MLDGAGPGIDPWDAYEPDDLWADAVVLELGVPQEHSIDPAGDEDWLTFTLDESASVVLETSDTLGDTKLWLYDADLVELEFNDDWGWDLSSRIETSLGAGTYYARVTAYGGDEIIPTYTVSLSLAQAAAPGDDWEPDDAWDQATLLEPGVPQEHSIGPVGDEDWLTFTLDEDRLVTLTTAGASGDTRLWLYDDSLAEIAFNDDGAEGLFSRIQTWLSSGTYYVEVDEFGDNDAIAAYTVSLDVSETVEAVDAYEPDDASDQATVLEPGVPQEHSIGPVGDEDWFTFTLGEDRLVALETSGPSGDTRLWLYDDGLFELAYDDDGGEGAFSRMDMVLSSGTYYVRVDEYAGNDTIASYTLSLEADEVPPPPGCLEVEVRLYEDAGGVPGELIGTDTVAEGETFFVEIAAGDIRDAPAGIVDLDLDVRWDPDVLEEIDVPFDPTALTSTLVTSNLPLSRGGTLDNGAGTVDELRGSSQPADAMGAAIGNGALDPFSLMLFRADQQTLGVLPFVVTLGDEGVSFADDAAAVVQIESQYLRVTAPGMSDMGEIHGRVWHDVDGDGVLDPGEQANSGSDAPSISSDGRYVAFESYADNLVPFDTNGSSDIFVHDRETGQTTRVSVSSLGAEADGESYGPSISANGRYVAFTSGASNLVLADANGCSDIFVHDRETGQTTRASVSSEGQEATGWSDAPTVSGDGRYVAFVSSASNLVQDDANGGSDIFMHDREAGETTRVSVSSAGEEGNGWSYEPSIDAGGRYVAFTSGSSNLVAGDTNWTEDVFVYDRETGETVRVSVSSEGEEGDGWSYLPSISGDGRYVAFTSDSSNLIAGDMNWTEDVFVRDRETGETTRVSISSEGDEADGASGEPAISGDGRHVAFRSDASNLASDDTNEEADVFVHDRGTGTTAPARPNTVGGESAITLETSGSDGDTEMWLYDESLSLLAYNDDWNDLFSHIETWLSDGTYYVKVEGFGGYETVDAYTVSLDGAPAGGPWEPNDAWHQATPLRVGVPQEHSIDPSGDEDWFTFALGDAANGRSYAPSISADGRYVAFASDASNLLADDTNGSTDIFLSDRWTNETTRVSRSSSEPPLAGWTVYLDVNENGRLDPDDYSTTTDGSGTYQFQALPAGTYQVVDVPSPGWTQTSPGSLSFAGPTDYSVGQGTCDPRAVAVGDLDNDGSPDLVVANWAVDAVSVLLNDGQGALDSAVLYGTGGSASALALGDLNGDGVLDITVASHDSDRVSVLLGQGDGTFAAATHIGVGQSPSSVVAGDLDGDGDLDLAVANRGSDEVLILLNDGGAAFTEVDRYLVGNQPQSLALADLDGNGSLDLAVANYAAANVCVLLNHGDGTFSLTPNLEVGSGPNAVHAADLNGDGHADLAVANTQGDSVTLLMGQGDGMFAPALDLPVGDGPAALTAVDLDGDQDLDLVVAHASSGDVWILENGGPAVFVQTDELSSGAPLWSVDAADLDGDGDLDLIVPKGDSSLVSVFDNDFGRRGHGVALGAGEVVTGIGFGGSPLPSEIHGRVWHDLNQDSASDAGEPALAGWTVYLDLNGNSQLDFGDPATQTTPDGAFSFVDLEAGLYTLAVAVPPNWVQTYPSDSAVHTIDLGAGQTARGMDFGNWEMPIDPDAHEPNDTWAQAAVLGLASGQIHSIHTPTDVDWFTFTLPDHSFVDIWALNSTGMGGHVEMCLYDDGLTELTRGESYGYETDIYAFTPLSRGTYFLAVSERGQDAVIREYELNVFIDPLQGSSGDPLYDPFYDVYYATTYALTLSLDGGQDPVSADDAGNSWDQATLLEDGVPQNHSIVPSGDEDWFTFALDEETTVALTTSGSYGDTEMWLYDEGLNQLAYNDDWTDCFSHIEMLLPNGIYYVRVEGFDGSEVVDAYTLTLSFDEALEPVVGDDAGDSWDEATILEDGVPQSHSISPSGDEDWFTFTVAEEATIALTTSGADGDTEMWLYDEGLNQLAYNDDWLDLFSHIEMSIPNGTYYAMVGGYGGFETVDAYMVTLDIGLGGGAGDPFGGGQSGDVDVYEPDNTWEQAGLLEPDLSQSHTTFPEADIDWFTFSLTGPSDVTLETSTVDGDTEMWLYGSDLTELAYDDDGGAGLSSRISVSLPDGGYYVMVAEYGYGWFGGPGLEDSYEPDDTRDYATLLEAETFQDHMLGPYMNRDWYTFTLEEETFVVLEMTGEMETGMWLYDDALSQIGSAQALYGEEISYSELLSAGTYHVKVRELYGWWEGELAPYTIGLRLPEPVGSGDQVYHGLLDGVRSPLFSESMDFVKPTLTDIDADGDLDLFLASSMPDPFFAFEGVESRLCFFRNDGNAQTPSWTFVTENYLLPQRGEHDPLLVDIDADGDLDMFLANSAIDTMMYGPTANLSFYRNDGDAGSPNWTFATGSYLDATFGDEWMPFFDTGVMSPTLVDVDSDKDLDLFFIGYDSIWHFRNDGSAQYPSWTFATDAYLDYLSDAPGFPTGMAFADIDADRDLDLFVGTDFGGISFYRNDGTPAVPRWNFMTDYYGEIEASGGCFPAFGDVDGDHDLDLLLGEDGGNVSFYRNNGSAQEATWAFVTDNYLSIDIGDRSVPAFADIDTDGDLDMFVGEKDGNIGFYRNDGHAQLPSWSGVTDNYGSIDSGESSVPAIADIDGDGDLDLFIGEEKGNISFYRNEGTVDAPSWVFVENDHAGIDVGFNAAPAFADIDGDTDLDLFVGNSRGNIWFYRNDDTAEPSGWVLETKQYGAIDVGERAAPWLEDIDQDGDFDLFVGERDGGVTFYRNDGDAQAPSWEYVTDTYVTTTTGWGACTVPTFTDIDDDGDADLFVGEGNGDIRFFRNEGVPPFSWTLANPGDESVFVGWDSAPALADIDGDGTLDLFVGNGDGTIAFFRNDGTAQDPSWTLVENGYVCAPTPGDAVPAFVDLDGDADLDLAVGGIDGSIWFCTNDGSADLSLWAPFAEPLFTNGFHAAPSFADIDGDADFDLFVSDWDGNFRFYRNDGNAQFPEWTLVTDRYASIDVGWSSPTFADIDSDGDSDFFVVDWDGTLSFYRNDGDAQTASWTLVPAVLMLETLPLGCVPALADIDSDGDLDLFMGDLTGLVSFYRNESEHALPMWNAVTSSFAPVSAGSNSAPVFADIDRNGTPDLFVGASDGSISFFRNNGFEESLASILADEYYASIDIGWDSAPTFADIDGDDDLDLFVGEGAGNISFYENTGNGQWSLATESYASVDVEWNAAPAFADIDDDGDLDLFVGDGDGRISFYENADGGQWDLKTGSYASIDAGYYAAPTFADIDGDGDLDLFVGGNNGTISFYLNEGGVKEPSWRLETSSFASVDVRWGSRPAFVDIDQDDDLDLFVGTGEGNVTFVRNDGNAQQPSWTLVTTNYVSATVGWSSAPAFADIDQDGTPELFVGESDGNINLFTSVTVFDTVSWTPESEGYGSINAIKASAPAFADIDGDGDLDLFVGQENGHIAFSQNDGDEATPSWTFVTDSYGDIVSGPWSVPTFGDLDGDGDLDLVVGDDSGYVSLYRNDLDEQPSGWTFVAADLLEGLDYGSMPALADFDNDGTLDLFVGNMDGHIRFYSLDGWDGDNPPEFTLVTEWFAGIDLPWGCAPAPVDIDGDADLDLFVGDGLGGLTFWRNAAPKLDVAPSRTTVPTGEALALTVRGDAGLLSWSFRDGWDNSDGTIDDEGHYVAGSDGGVVDCIEVESADGLIGRTYINVVSAADVSAAGKAIIVAGRRANDYIWSATNHMANFAYTTLRYRGFSADNIYYLSPETEQDVDGDGVVDVDAATTLDNLEYAFEDWASDANVLTVYLVDHGGSDPMGNAQFRLNPSEILTGKDLDGWLDAWQTDDRWAAVVIDACQSGSFLDELQPKPGSDRIVIGSTTIDAPSYFVADGVISFSDVFWSSIYAGRTVMAAFEAAADSMSFFQSPQLDDNGDGVYTDGVDGEFASTCYIGASYIGGADRPEIGEVSGNQILESGTEATIWAEGVSGVYPTTHVWAVVVPPSFKADPKNPVTNLPEIELLYNWNTGRWEGTHDGFTEPGTYAVIIHAQDIWDSLSIPKQTYITQREFDERTILLAGSGAFSETAPWEATDYLADYVDHTLHTRMFDDDHIYYLHPDAGHDGEPTLDDLEAAMDWADDAEKLNLYFVGHGEPAGFRLNDDEVLSPTYLDTLLDTYQGTHDGPVTVIFDASHSGNWIADLVPPQDRERVVIASAPAGEAALCSPDGRASFTQFFMNEVFMGRTVREAFANTQATTDSVLGQWDWHQLDDNANGQANERLTDDGRPGDGEVARHLHLGSAFVTGTDLPVIGDTSGGAIFSWDGPALLWASDISDADGIARVWATVVPPSYDADAGDTISVVDLVLNEETDRYEGLFDEFVEGEGYALSLLSNDRWTVTVPRPDGTFIDIYRLVYNSRTRRYTTVLEGSIRQGAYGVSFYAEDAQGNVIAYSPDGSREVPSQDEPPAPAGPGDAYEDDDSEARATIIGVEEGAQEHDFHDAGDKDWASFYGLRGKTYVIEAADLGENCHAILELYDEDISLLMRRDSWWAEDHARVSWECEEDGEYYIKVTHLDPTAAGPDTEYRLSVYTPEAFLQPVVVTGRVVDSSPGGAGVGGVSVVATGRGATHGSDITKPNGSYRLVLAAGTYTLTASSDVYRPGSTPSVHVNPHSQALSQDITVTPVGVGPRDIQVSHDYGAGHENEIAFGGVWIGADTQSYTVTIENRGFEDLTVTATTLSDGTNYSVVWDRDGVPPDTILARTSRVATITFDPTSQDDFPATFTIDSDDPDEPRVELALTGSGLPLGTQVLTTDDPAYTFYDLDGDLVTVRLLGTGEVRVKRDVTDPDAWADIENLELVETDAGTEVRIEVQDVGNAPNDGTSVQTITGSGAGRIHMPDGDLVGNTVDLTGALGSLIVRDIMDGSDILLDGEITDRLTITGRDVGDVDVEFAGVLARLDVSSWAAGEIEAHYLGELYARDGDFGANLTLAGADDAGLSLSAAEVTGDLTADGWTLPGTVGRLHVSGDVESDIDVTDDLGRQYRVRRGRRSRWYTEGFWCGGDLEGAVTVGGTAWQVDIDGELRGALTIGGDAERIVLAGGASANGEVTVGLALTYLEAGGPTFAADLKAGSIGEAYINSTNGLEGTIAVTQKVDVNRDGDTDDAVDTAGNTGGITNLRVQNGTATGSAVTAEGDLGGLESYRRRGRRRWRTVGFWSGGDVNGTIDVAGQVYLFEIAPEGELGGALQAGSMQDVSLLGGMAQTGRIQTLRTVTANGDLVTTGDVVTLRLGEDVEGDVDVGGHLETLEIGYRTGRRGRILNDASFTGTLQAGSIGNAYCHATTGLEGTVEVVRRDIDGNGDRDDDVDTTGSVGGFYVYGGAIDAAVHIEGSVTEFQAHHGTTAAGTLTVDGDLGGLRLTRRRGRRRWVPVGFWSGGDVMAHITVSGVASLIDIDGDLVDASINPLAATAGELETVTVSGQIHSTGPQWVRAAIGTFYISDTTWSGYITATTPHVFTGPVTAQIG